MSHNPFVRPETVEGYESWYETVGRRADRLEKALLRRQLARFSGSRSVLEVGCGTGHFTRWLAALGMDVVGLDASGPMLAEATRLATPRCVRGDAEALPWARGSFDLVVLITTLEFVPDPRRTLVEAVRVARRGLVVGSLNRTSLLGRQLAATGAAPWSAAHLLTPFELVDLIRQAARPRRVAISWQTTLWPWWSGALPLPWGGFIGLAARLS